MKHLLLTTIAAVVLVGCGGPSIHKAAETGNIKAVKQHLAAGVDVNAGNRTPLFIAAANGHKQIVELLLDKGSDVNTKGRMGTPLHAAVSFKGHHKEITELLIAAGADVNAKDEGGRTPLDMAFMSDFMNSMSHQDPQNFISSEKALEDWDAFKEETETADLLRKHGGKTGEELKAEGK